MKLFSHLSRRAPIVATALAMLFLLTGCSPKATTASQSTATAAENPTAATNNNRTVFGEEIPTKPNPRLQTLKLYVGANELTTELALSDLQIHTGMMFRTNILENEAMLFVFTGPRQVGFWMKNVDIPLSCAYIDPDGIILETHDMVAHEEKPIESASDRVQFVLETKKGWFDRHDIKPGVLIRTERGSLLETFFRRRTP
ncbi:hypothetical protein GC207_12265 [bacterium]|nr:hypothetical protein [bacterium]